MLRLLIHRTYIPYYHAVRTRVAVSHSVLFVPSSASRDDCLDGKALAMGHHDHSRGRLLAASDKRKRKNTNRGGLTNNLTGSVMTKESCPVF